MILKIFEIIFIILGVLQGGSIIIYKLFFSKLKDNITVSNYVAFITGVILLYFLFGIFCALFINGISKKIIMLLFASAPFIIGKFVNYRNEKIYGIIQIMLSFLSVRFLCLFG